MKELVVGTQPTEGLVAKYLLQDFRGFGHISDPACFNARTLVMQKRAVSLAGFKTARVTLRKM